MAQRHTRIHVLLIMAAAIPVAAMAGWTTNAWPTWDYTREGEAWQRDVWSGLVERALAVGINPTNLQYYDTNATPELYRSGRDNLVLAKRDLLTFMPYFLDSRNATGGNFNAYFAQPGNVTLPPAWSVTGLCQYLTIPTNYFYYTPYRALSCCGPFTDEVANVGHPYGWPVLPPAGDVYIINATGFVFNSDTSYPSPNGIFARDESVSTPTYFYYTNWNGNWFIENFLPGVWSLEDSGFFEWFQADASTPLGGATSLTWSANFSPDTAGVTLAVATFPASANPGGDVFPASRTQWYTTDYGWCYLSNIMAQLVFTGPISNNMTAGTNRHGAAYGYKPPNDSILDGGTTYDLYDEFGGVGPSGLPFSHQTWLSVTGLWTNATANYVGTWQQSGSMSLTNVWTSGNEVRHAVVNTRTNWPSIVKYNIYGTATNTHASDFDIYACTEWRDTPDPEYGRLYHNDGSPATCAEGPYLAQRYTPTDASTLQLASGDRWLILSSSTATAAKVSSETRSTTTNCYTENSSVTTAMIHTESDYQWIEKEIGGKFFNAWLGNTNITAQAQLYLCGKWPAEALSVGSPYRQWDSLGINVNPSNYVMSASTNIKAASWTWDGIATNTARPFTGSYATWQGFVVSNFLHIINWQFEYK